MKRYVSAMAVAMLLTSAAWAAFMNIDSVERFMKAGMYVHPGSVALSSTNKVTRMLAGSINVNFDAGTSVCDDSDGGTITGAQVGDPCIVGTPAVNPLNTDFTCFVSAANTVHVRACHGGAESDPATATYYMRVISNQ